ncbi:hypothetical protein BD289DRAFT_435482 [Coniella lustricola]|uniref:SnoaL-like domain-containing protein n=1 Tax=Coniella lustricola TaxID=2025994 RepID=A0A2T3A6I3_9PEZI|nr:hypothetical protein BD289DRAFT_435482 [Coniella lustricola]
MTALPAVLSPALAPREAIVDALYRCVNGLDSKDQTLFESAFTNDATFDLNGNVMEGLPAISTCIYDMIAKMDTTHFVTNVRVHIESETKASVTATALAQHYHGGQGLEPDAANFLAGSLYWGDLVKDESDGGLWKCTSWRMKTSWGIGDRGVFAN